MSYEQTLGSVHVQPCQQLAAKCAEQILGFKSPRAVTLDPEGRVFVESVRKAAEADIVGVYAPELGILELSRHIAEDLLFEKAERGLVQRHRRPVRAQRKGQP